VPSAHLLEIAVGRCNDPHVDGDGLVSAHALELALLQEAQQLDLDGGRDLADFVEKERALVRLLEAAVTPSLRARERTALVSEELAFQQRLGEGRAVQLHEGALRPRAAFVNGGGDQLLARPRLARDEHAGSRRGDLRDGLEDRIHGSGTPHDVGEAVFLSEAGAQQACFLAQATVLELARHHQGQLAHIDGFGEVVSGPGAHGSHGRLDLAEGRHDHHGQIGIQLVQLAQQLDSVHAGHLEIGHHDFGREVGYLAEGLEAVSGRLGRVALVAEELGESRAGIDLVVDDEDSTLGL